MPQPDWLDWNVKMVQAGIHLMSWDEANNVAEVMNRDTGDDWSYEAIHGNHVSGLSYVEVSDGAGQLVGRL